MKVLLVVLAVGVLTPALAVACGACAEDKMAATYDYTVVQTAVAQKRQVVFCDVQGRVQQERLRQAAAQVAGIDPTSIRTSAEPSALSFALDTKVQSADAAVAQIRTRLDNKVQVIVLKGLSVPGVAN